MVTRPVYKRLKLKERKVHVNLTTSLKNYKHSPYKHSRVTSPAAEVEGAKEEGKTTEAIGYVVSTRGYFGRSWASLH